MAKNEKWPRIRVDSIEDEAWNLLHESIVYYCNPVVTIAANDWSSTSILNCDHMWEKTMDCPSPGQGLMPTSFKALFYLVLLCACEMQAPEDGSANLIQALTNRMVALSFHIREYYWIDIRNSMKFMVTSQRNIHMMQLISLTSTLIKSLHGGWNGCLIKEAILSKTFNQLMWISDYFLLEASGLLAHCHAKGSKWDTSLLCARRSSGKRPYIECVLLDESPLKIGLSSSTLWLEMVCEVYGGRVDLAKVYHKAIIAFVRKHFKGSSAIVSMKLCNDFMSLE
ncbi:hypothetical protein Nepgr_021010 [Nepenthes gracilis]|uniref:Alkaline/neutral invertase n=1 Tax=Nepenthes gracilis TaxID=150966 RepID=A0AAD3XWN9_NEPGR|nr:hypothetical protein Nepgr_021010 [Nepenthes gracilis]